MTFDAVAFATGNAGRDILSALMAGDSGGGDNPFPLLPKWETTPTKAELDANGIVFASGFYYLSNNESVYAFWAVNEKSIVFASRTNTANVYGPLGTNVQTLPVNQGSGIYRCSIYAKNLDPDPVLYRCSSVTEGLEELAQYI